MGHLARIWISAALTFLCCASFAQTQKPQNNPQPKPVGIPPITMKLVGDYGGWWNATPESDRYTILGAYLDAMREVHDMAHGMGMEVAKEAVPGAATFNCKMEDAVAFSVMAEQFDFEVKEPFVPKLNAFYIRWYCCRITAAGWYGQAFSQDIEGLRFPSAAYLRGADLRGAYLQGELLFSTNLRDAILDGAQLQACFLVEADLSGADLSNADLGNAYLHDAVLTGANFAGANLEDAELTDAICDRWTLSEQQLASLRKKPENASSSENP